MAIKSTTTDSDGDVVSVTVSAPTATISFGRKVGLPNYSNEEMSLFLQVPLPEGATLDDVEKALDPQIAFVKAFVYKQLGVPFGMADNGVVVGEVPDAPPAKGKKPAGAAKPKPKAKADKDEYWAALAIAKKEGDNWRDQDGDLIYDNRENKRNPKGPDFKFADAGVGLWLTDKPTWFTEPGEGMTL